MTERDLLTRLHAAIDRVPGDAPVNDWVYLMCTNKCILGLVLSGDPAHAHRATEKLDALESFICEREQQHWREPAPREQEVM